MLKITIRSYLKDKRNLSLPVKISYRALPLNFFPPLNLLYVSLPSHFSHTDDYNFHNFISYLRIFFVIYAAVKASFVVFLLSVSELLMGEVDSSTLLSLLPTEKSRVSGSLIRATSI